MKRLNRKKLIEEFEFLRQGFKDAHDLIATELAQKVSMKAYHKNADRCVVELGGESVLTKEKDNFLDKECCNGCTIDCDACEELEA